MKKPQLLVREVDPELVKELKKRAVANGRSAEAEHRKILEDALRTPKRITLAEALLKIPPYGQDSDFERRDEDGSRDVFN
ncbi:MAG: Arc family DNA-binding protein [Granulosicoccus sp.]|nr:Arc family DNA-binding protein [Granulosicoccus sp.]